MPALYLHRFAQNGFWVNYCFVYVNWTLLLFISAKNYFELLYIQISKCHSRFLLLDIHHLILNARKPWHFWRISWIIRRSCPKKLIGCWWRNHLKARILQNSKIGLQQLGKFITRVFLPQIFFLQLFLFWMYNKRIIGFGLRIISRIILT